jgi:hypothetical protein
MMSDECISVLLLPPAAACSPGNLGGVGAWRAPAKYERREAPWTHV